MIVYQKALAAAISCEDVARKVPLVRRDLADQLRRASASIPLNVAEGAAEMSPKEKARIYRIARRSACECSAALDLIDHVLGDCSATKLPRQQLGETLALLANTIRAVEAGRKR